MTQEELEKLVNDFASESDRISTIFHVGLVSGYIRGRLNPKIKKLEWEENDVYQSAKTPFGEYVIPISPTMFLIDREDYSFKLTFEDIVIVTDKNIAFLKDVAQKDFERRVMECVETV